MALEETNSSNASGYFVRLICFTTEYSMQCEISAFPFACVTYESWINSEMCIYFLASTNFNDITWLLLIASMTISIYFLEYLYHCMQYEMLFGYANEQWLRYTVKLQMYFIFMLNIFYVLYKCIISWCFRIKVPSNKFCLPNKNWKWPNISTENITAWISNVTLKTFLHEVHTMQYFM